MLSVSAACQDFPNHFQIIEDHEVPGGVKKEICNYLLWGLDPCNEQLVSII